MNKGEIFHEETYRKEDYLIERSKGLFNYIKEVVKLGLKIYRKVDEHSENFIIFESDISNQEGILLFEGNKQDFPWLTILRQTIPTPPPLNKEIKDWIIVSSDPFQEPEIIEKRTLISGNKEKECNFYDEEIRVETYLKYLESWEKWSKEVKNKFKVQRLFNDFFRIKEIIKYNEKLELIWGYGILLWKNEKIEIKYPIITQRMSIEHDFERGIINLYPEDDSEPQLELKILSDTGLPDISYINDKFKTHFYETGNTYTKKENFLHDNFSKFLYEIARKLSPEGDFITLKDKEKFSPTSKLRIVNSWVIFLRKRQEDAILRDAENFLQKINKEKNNLELAEAFLSFVDNPKKELTKNSAVSNFDEWNILLNKDILFPKPANKEQIQIINRFKSSKGVVVWGPPGTGKSHTIANIISHFMAKGKRILVTSQKDQPLAVLHEMMPETLRPLCISVLRNISDSRERLKRAVEEITKIATTSREEELVENIKRDEKKLDILREELVKIEEKIKDLSKKQFAFIEYKGKILLSSELIKIMKQEEEKHLWFQDTINYHFQLSKKDSKEIIKIIPILPLNEKEIEKLKKIREEILSYLDDFYYNFPEINKIFDEERFQEIRREVKRNYDIDRSIKNIFPGIIFKSEKNFDESIIVLENTIEILDRIDEEWQWNLISKLRKKNDFSEKIRRTIRSLDEECRYLKQYYHKINLLNSISLNNEIELDLYKKYVKEKLSFLKKGKKIDLRKIFSNKKRKAINFIKINDKSPSSIRDWEEVINYINFLIALKSFRVKWNNSLKVTGAPSIKKNSLQEEAENILELVEKLKDVLTYEVYLKKVKKNINEIIINGNAILNDSSIRKIYKILKLKKESLKYKEYRLLLNKVKLYLSNIIAKGKPHPIIYDFIDCINNIEKEWVVNKWIESYQKLKIFLHYFEYYKVFEELLKKMSFKAPLWAKNWKKKNIKRNELCPDYWIESIYFHAIKKYLSDISRSAKEINKLENEQEKLINDIRNIKETIVSEKVKLSIVNNLTQEQLMALKRWHLAVVKLGKGKGKYSWQKENLVRKEMYKAKESVPVWIMPVYRVSESVPSEFGIFDVVIVDEASQCDIRALLSLARGKKVIIVGDPEQTSPEAIGINREENQKIISKYLKDIPNKNYFTMDTSLYDLANIVFSGEGELMLREHFRCLPEIIEFSNKLSYDGKILPLRNPPPHMLLNPVLESIYIKEGKRDKKSNINIKEAEAICEKVKEIVNDVAYKNKTIGIISLLGNNQAKYIFNILGDYVSPEIQEKHKLRVGDPYSFQGDERDVMLLSMVVGDQDEKRVFKLAYDNRIYRQRFNVAVSRARDKLILFHSIKLKNLSHDDLRYLLIYYIKYKMLPTEGKMDNIDLGEFDSQFEKDVYEWLVYEGYDVSTHVKIGHYYIDLVVEGENSRVGIECDGSKWHPPEQWWNDQLRQRQLERMGWKILRIWGIEFYSNRDYTMKTLIKKLKELKIYPKRKK